MGNASPVRGNERKMLVERIDQLSVSMRALSAAMHQDNCKSREELAVLTKRFLRAKNQKETLERQLDQIEAVRTNATVLESKVLVQSATVTAAQRVGSLGAHAPTRGEVVQSAARVTRVTRDLEMSGDAVSSLTDAISDAASSALDEANDDEVGQTQKDEEETARIVAQWEDARALDRLASVPEDGSGAGRARAGGGGVLEEEEERTD